MIFTNLVMKVVNIIYNNGLYRLVNITYRKNVKQFFRLLNHKSGMVFEIGSNLAPKVAAGRF